MSATDIRTCGLCFDWPIIPGADRCVQCADKSSSLLAVRSHMLFISLQAEREKVAKLEAKVSELTARLKLHARFALIDKLTITPEAAKAIIETTGPLFVVPPAEFEHVTEAVAAERERIAKIADDRFRQWSERAEQATTKGDYERRAAAGAEARHIAEAIRRGE